MPAPVRTPFPVALRAELAGCLAAALERTREPGPLALASAQAFEALAEAHRLGPTHRALNRDWGRDPAERTRAIAARLAERLARSRGTQSASWLQVDREAVLQLEWAEARALAPRVLELRQALREVRGLRVPLPAGLRPQVLHLCRQQVAELDERRRPPEQFARMLLTALVRLLREAGWPQALEALAERSRPAGRTPGQGARASLFLGELPWQLAEAVRPGWLKARGEYTLRAGCDGDWLLAKLERCAGLRWEPELRASF